MVPSLFHEYAKIHGTHNMMRTSIGFACVWDKMRRDIKKEYKYNRQSFVHACKIFFLHV
jgi:hypothetical protein